jgi:hypothetical protein
MRVFSGFDRVFRRSMILVAGTPETGRGWNPTRRWRISKGMQMGAAMGMNEAAIRFMVALLD